jgi:hypothetical protein
LPLLPLQRFRDEPASAYSIVKEQITGSAEKPAETGLSPLQNGAFTPVTREPEKLITFGPVVKTGPDAF